MRDDDASESILFIVLWMVCKDLCTAKTANKGVSYPDFRIWSVNHTDIDYGNQIGRTIQQTVSGKC